MPAFADNQVIEFLADLYMLDTQTCNTTLRDRLEGALWCNTRPLSVKDLNILLAESCLSQEPPRLHINKRLYSFTVWYSWSYRPAKSEIRELKELLHSHVPAGFVLKIMALPQRRTRQTDEYKRKNR